MNSPFEIYEIPKKPRANILRVDRRQMPWFVRPLKRVNATF
jgi:hypothetical protein